MNVAHSAVTIHRAKTLGRDGRGAKRSLLPSRIVFSGPEKRDDWEEFGATPTRRFTLLEITSGLPDDSREADEHEGPASCATCADM